MFEIKYRIADDFQELKVISKDAFNSEWDQISGFFRICFGEHQEGSYYHSPLNGEEEGSELLDYWFDKLLMVLMLLDSSSDYVAFREIDTSNRWLEFKKQGDSILINAAADDLYENNSLLITEKGSFSYIEPLDFNISYHSFKTEVLTETNNFLEELKCLNPELKHTDMVIALSEKVKMIES